MPTQGKDYQGIYSLQDKVLSLFKDRLAPFYLTGGTALDNYYLKKKIDIQLFKEKLLQISDDIILGLPNRLGINKTLLS